MTIINLRRLIALCVFLFGGPLLFTAVSIDGDPSSTPHGLHVTREQFGDEWPFTVSEGFVESIDNAIVFHTTDGKTYALNGIAMGRGCYLDIEPIWRPHPVYDGMKISVGPLIDAGIGTRTGVRKAPARQTRKDSAEKRPRTSHSSPQSGSQTPIVCDEFSLVTELGGSKLDVAIETDLPDDTIVMISVSRSYWEKGGPAEYSVDYFSEKSTIGKWKSVHRISVAGDKWSSALRAKQKEMSQFGLGFEVATISDKIKVRMIVPMDQANPRFGEGNSNLIGKAVDAKGFRVVCDEIEIEHPLDSASVSQEAGIADLTYRGVGFSATTQELLRAIPTAELNEDHPGKGISTYEVWDDDFNDCVLLRFVDDTLIEIAFIYFPSRVASNGGMKAMMARAIRKFGPPTTRNEQTRLWDFPEIDRMVIAFGFNAKWSLHVYERSRRLAIADYKDTTVAVRYPSILVSKGPRVPERRKVARTDYLPARQSSAGVPLSVLRRIRENAKREWGDDYEMQQYEIENQVEAYRAVRGYTAQGIPASLLKRIIRNAVAEWPGDYEMQEYEIKNQVEAYRRLSTVP